MFRDWRQSWGEHGEQSGEGVGQADLRTRGEREFRPLVEEHTAGFQITVSFNFMS